MSKKQILFFIISLFIFTVHSELAHASSYGWGYKKNNDHVIPDVGKFEKMIKKHHAYYADHSGDKHIYLTFDNGYEQGYTESILNVLKEENIPATFFVTGHYVKSEPDLVKRMVEDGHIIGNHSYHHPDFTTLSNEKIKKELVMVEEAVAEITIQKKMKYLRPPRGTFNEQTLKVTNELGYMNIFWSLAFADWHTEKQKGKHYAYEQVMNQIHPGAIILLHTVSSDNAEALSDIIKDLKKQGFQFKSLDDLVLKAMMPKELYGF